MTHSIKFGTNISENLVLFAPQKAGKQSMHFKFFNTRTFLLQLIFFGLCSFIPLDSNALAEKTGSSGCVVEDSSWTGSYYYKIRSTEEFEGFAGTAILPQVSFDSQRYWKFNPENPSDNPLWEGPMDRPSIYIGTRSNMGSSEIDCGLTWNQVLDKNGNKILIDASNNFQNASDASNWYTLSVSPPVLRGPSTIVNPQGEVIASGWKDIQMAIFSRNLKYHFAFCPFYRTSTWNPTQDVFFMPGELVTIKLTHKKNTFRLAITSDSVSFIKEFTRKGYNQWAKGYSFKRINAIDQFRVVDGKRKGNEGPGVKTIPTTTSALQGGWESAYLLDVEGKGTPFQSPFCIQTRGQDTLEKYDQIFNSSGINSSGGEFLDIRP